MTHDCPVPACVPGLRIDRVPLRNSRFRSPIEHRNENGGIIGQAKPDPIPASHLQGSPSHVNRLLPPDPCDPVSRDGRLTYLPSHHYRYGPLGP